MTSCNPLVPVTCNLDVSPEAFPPHGHINKHTRPLLAPPSNVFNDDHSMVPSVTTSATMTVHPTMTALETGEAMTIYLTMADPVMVPRATSLV